jgi:hypothetical protein
MFAVLLRFTLSFVYKVCIGFLSRMPDWTVAVAQYNKFENMAVYQPRHVYIFQHDI